MRPARARPACRRADPNREPRRSLECGRDAVAYEGDLLAGLEAEDIRDLMRLLPTKDDRVCDVVLDEEPVGQAVMTSRTQSERSSRSTMPSPSATNAERTSRSA